MVAREAEWRAGAAMAEERREAVAREAATWAGATVAACWDRRLVARVVAMEGQEGRDRSKRPLCRPRAR